MLSKNLPLSLHDNDLAESLRLTLREVDRAIGIVDARSRNILAAKIQGSVDANDGIATSPLRRTIGGDLQSRDINNLMMAVFFDLQHIYIRLRRSRSMRQARDTVKHASIDDVDLAYQKMKTRVKELEARIRHRQHDHSFYFNFASTVNEYRGVNRAIVDHSTSRLTIPSKRAVNIGENSRIEVTQATGGVVSNDSSHPPAFAVDPDPVTYWSQSTVNATPLPLVDIQLGGTTYYTQTGEYISGAAVHLDVFLQKPTAMNQVKILPFSTYPIKIVDISYRESDDDSLKQIPIFDTRLATPNKDYVTFQFALLYAKQIRITLAQETYEEVSYLLDHDKVIVNRHESTLDTQDQLLIDTLNQARTALLELDSSTARAEDIMENAIVVLGRAVEQINPKAGRRIAKTVQREFETAPNQVKGYVYNIGVSDIQILNVSYLESAQFKSVNMDPGNDIFRIQLETTEEHPVLYDNDGQPHRQTSIDWSIDVGDGRSIPLLPVGSVDNSLNPFIFGERLATQSGSALTRWTIDTTKFYQVRANGAATGKFNLRTVGNRSRVTLVDYNPNLTYTITYYPLIDTSHFNPTDILLEDYISSLSLDDEVFDGTDDTGAIELSRYPFVTNQIVNDIDSFWRPNPFDAIWRFRGADNDVLAYADSDSARQPVRVANASIDLTHSYFLIEGKKWGNISGNDEFSSTYEPIVVQVSGEKAFNITDYLLGITPDFMDSKIGRGTHHYMHDGRRLVFDGSIEGEIRVRYSALTTSVRLIAKLNCDRSFPRDLTPMIKEATLLTSGRIV